MLWISSRSTHSNGSSSVGTQYQSGQLSQFTRTATHPNAAHQHESRPQLDANGRPMVRICWGQAAFGNCGLLDCLTAKTEALHKALRSTAVIIKHHSSKSNQSAIKSNSCKWGISGVLGIQWHRSGSKILPTEKEQKLTISVQSAWIVPCTVFVAEYGRNGTTSSPFCLRSVHYSTTESLI